VIQVGGKPLVSGHPRDCPFGSDEAPGWVATHPGTAAMSPVTPQVPTVVELGIIAVVTHDRTVG